MSTAELARTLDEAPNAGALKITRIEVIALNVALPRDFRGSVYSVPQKNALITRVYTDHGPVGRSILTSSQSDNPTSPHHADQTLLFSRKESKPIRFAGRGGWQDSCVDCESAWLRNSESHEPLVEECRHGPGAFVEHGLE